MRMRFFFIFFLTTTIVKAQDKAFELITDRPDQTESSTVVPYKSLQIETGFVLENNKTNLIEEKLYTYNTTLFRYGLLWNFELRLGLEYLGSVAKSKITDTKNTITGLSPLYAGFKVKVAEEEDWRPEVAFLGGLVLPYTAHENFKPSYSAANIRFAFSHTFSDRFSMGYNLGAEWDGETAIPGYFYSFAFGMSIINKLGMFVESYGLVPDVGSAEHLLDAGFTFLVSPDFQLDVSGGIGLDDNSPDNFFSFGLTYRIHN